MGFITSLPRPLTGILWALAVLAGLVLLAWAALALLFPPARVRALVEAQASSVLAREVRFEDASIGLLPPVRLTVRQPAIAEAGGFEKGTAVQARSLYLDLDVLALLGRRVVVRRLELQGAVLHVVMRDDGGTNLDGIGAPQQAPGSAPAKPDRPMDIAIQSLRVRDGEVLIDDGKARRRTVFNLDSDLSLALQGGERIVLSGTSTLSNVAFGPLSARRREDLQQGIAGIRWSIEHRGVFDASQKRLALERLALKFGRAEIAFSGRVDDPGPKARVDLRAQGANVDFGEVLDILAQADAAAMNGISGAGQMAFDLGIRGALGPDRLPDIVGTLSVREAAFRYPGAEAGVEALQFNVRFAPDTLDVRDITARVTTRGGDATPVRARLSITRFDAPHAWFSIVGDVDLAAVAPLVASKDTRLAGRARLDVRGAGPVKDPGAMALEGDATLDGVSVESPELPGRIDEVRGRVRFTQSRAVVSGLSARAGKSSFTLDADVRRPLALTAKPNAAGETVAPAEVQFKLSSPHLDLAELLPVTPGTPVLPNARGGGTITVARFIRDRLDVRDMQARVDLSPSVVEVPSFQFAGYGGMVGGAARFNMADPAKPVFAISAKVTRVEANDILSTWTPAKGLLQGSLSSDIELSGEGIEAADITRSLTAVGLAAIANGTFGPGPVLERVADFTKVPAFKELRMRDGTFPFAVEEGRVSFREVHFSGSTGDWRVAGSVGFDGTLDYAVSTTLPAELAGRLGTAGALAAGAIKDPDGRILLDLRVYGPASSPKVAWDKNAMLERLMGRSSHALSEKGDELGRKALEALEGRGGGVPDTSLEDYEKRLKAIADSLRKLKAKDVLKNLFGGKRDTVL